MAKRVDSFADGGATATASPARPRRRRPGTWGRPGEGEEEGEGAADAAHALGGGRRGAGAVLDRAPSSASSRAPRRASPWRRSRRRLPQNLGHNIHRLRERTVALEALGVPPTASQAEIRAAYRRRRGSNTTRTAAREVKGWPASTPPTRSRPSPRAAAVTITPAVRALRPRRRGGIHWRRRCCASCAFFVWCNGTDEMLLSRGLLCL